MSCQTHRRTLLDLARGSVPAEESAAAARGHAAECPACGRWLTEQQRLTVSLRALARDTRVAAPAEMQRRLEAAFGVYHAGSQRGARDWMKWSAAAAIVICAIGFGVWRLRPAPSPVPAVTQASRPAEPARRPDTPAVTTASPVSSPREYTVSASSRPSSRPPLPNRAAVADRPFVAIPASGALPPLETAQIFRVEVPVGALPAYGFDIAPDATGSYVTADVLVGQDGQPRAIRLVNSDQSAGSRR